MSKHTPGPWMVDVKNFDIIIGPIKGVNDARATVARASFALRSNEEVEANARLIAAAPDLLESCQAMLAHIDEVKDDTDLMQCRRMLRTAIVKATQ